MYDVYVAGKLAWCANPEERKKFYEDIAEVCEECGLSAYLPHQHTDPVMHPNFTPREVYERNYQIVADVKMIIAYAGQPSTGLGTELEIAKNNSTDIILIFRKDEKVSRMASGNPGIKFVVQYESEKDALDQLRIILNNWK